MALRWLAPSSYLEQLAPSPAVSSLQAERVPSPKNRTPPESDRQASPSYQTPFPSQLTGAPQTSFDTQTRSDIVFARDLIPQLHAFAFPSNVAYGKQVVFSPSHADKIHIISDGSLPSPTARITSVDLLLRVQLWVRNFGRIYQGFQNYIRVDRMLAILDRFKLDMDTECQVVEDLLGPSLDRLYEACRVGVTNLQHRQRFRARLREYYEIRLTMHAHKPSYILVHSVQDKDALIRAVLKAWEPHGQHGQQVCLHFETDRGDSIREIADWRDTINPAYKTFKMPPLFANDAKIHGYPEPQHSSGSETAVDRRAVEQEVCSDHPSI